MFRHLLRVDCFPEDVDAGEDPIWSITAVCAVRQFCGEMSGRGDGVGDEVPNVLSCSGADSRSSLLAKKSVRCRDFPLGLVHLADDIEGLV